MTPTQMARVASAVTGRQFAINKDGEITDYREGYAGDQRWEPKFEYFDSVGNRMENTIARSQALAVVEWLFARSWARYTNGVFSDNVDYNRRLYHAETARIGEHVYNKGLPALITLAHQLLENEDG